MADDRDPCSEFQRAFSALGVTHLVAPSPQAKGKIERRFGTLQKRLFAILAYEKVGSYAAAQIVLDREVQRQNATVCRTTGLSPSAAWENALAQKRTATRPCPPSPLLDLHLALPLKRRVNPDSQIDFLGRSWHISPTKRSSITLIHHPMRQFWAVTRPHRLRSITGRKSLGIIPCKAVSF
ncbi:MAG: Integrase catalytic region [Pedosphaera sp.]|nr:Integrase catalytic region [Pedosphaera sp.]